MEERLPRPYFLPLGEIHRLDDAIDLRRDGDGLNRRHDSVRFDDVGDGGSARGDDGDHRHGTLSTLLLFGTGGNAQRRQRDGKNRQRCATGELSQSDHRVHKDFRGFTNVLRVSPSMCSETSAAAIGAPLTERGWSFRRAEWDPAGLT